MKHVHLFSCLFSILLAGCTSASLGVYSGSLSDLFPEKIGDFKRETAPSELKADVPYLKSKGSYLAYYKLGREHCDVIVKALNFLSADEANEGMREVRRQQIPDRVVDDRLVWSVNEGPKKKGMTKVGDRFEAVGSTNLGKRFMILWTNGSVFFIVDHSGYIRRKEEEIQCQKDLRDFENSFSY